MDFRYEVCHSNAKKELIDNYSNVVTSPVDSFLEEHILGSKFYKIVLDNNEIGYFGIYNDTLLTQLYIKDKYFKYGQNATKDIIEKFNIEKAFVPTCDEIMLSLVIDNDVTIEKQAYFFQDSKDINNEEKLYQNGTFRKATLRDIDEIINISGNFFDKLEERIKENEIYVFTENNELLGIGIIEYGKVLKSYGSIGMFVNEKHRLKGIGGSILVHLKKEVYNKGLTPIAGCWYYNTNSKKTLESICMISKTRLLNITFNKD